jgi:hypothetical protein
MKLNTESITIVLTVAVLSLIPAIVRRWVVRKAHDERTIEAALHQRSYRVSWVMIGFCALQFGISVCFFAVAFNLPNPEIGSICFFAALSLAPAFLGALSLRRFLRISVVVADGKLIYQRGNGVSIVELRAIKRVYTSAWLIVMELEDGRKARVPMLFSGSHRLLARLQHTPGRTGSLL